MGKIQTFSIVIGTRACNAKCPFCVSSMTGFGELPKNREIDEINLRKACLLAKQSGCTTVLFTGKGEPTLYPDEITTYLEKLEPHAFPKIELQTNALEIGRLARGRSRAKLDESHLKEWRAQGLDTIAISTVGIDPALNARVYDHDYPKLEVTVAYLRHLGFTVRLCVMMMRGGVDSPKALERVIDWCRANDVAHLKVQTLRKPKRTEDAEGSAFVAEHGLDDAALGGIADWLSVRGTVVMRLMHGALVYDVDGQNVCLSDCLTVEQETDDIRTLIYYADGRLAYDWQYDGAILLSGRADPEKLVTLRKRG